MQRILLFKETWKQSFLFTTLFCLLFAGSHSLAMAQEPDKKVSFTCKEQPLSEALNQLERLSGYYKMNFHYGELRTYKVTAAIENKTVPEAVDILLGGLPLKKEINGKFIVIAPNELGGGKKAQKNIAQGKVELDNGELLPGVTVQVKGESSLGTITDGDGYFSISLGERTSAVLVFSFIGMVTKEVTYSGQPFLTVFMDDDVVAMNEVVVTGYQVIDRKKLTSAVSSVKAEDIMIQGVTSIDQMLQGRIPDMMLTTNSGEVGVVPKIRIRGTSTLIGNREPLWVVDGIVLNDPVDISPEELNDPDYVNRIGNAIAGLNPQDIDRIDVLKDASATALYGTKAANGVIVVTTKRGQVGKTKVRYNGTVSFKLRPRYTDSNVNVMNSRERVAFSKELVEAHHIYPTDMTALGYEGLIAQLYAGSITDSQFKTGVGELETRNTDWFKLLTEDALSHQHTVSLSGGSEQLRYYASVGYSNDNDVIKNAGNDRYTASINLDAHFSPKLTLSFGLNGNVSSRDYNQSSIAPIDYAYNTSRTIPAYGTDGTYYYYKPSSDDYSYNILNELENSYSKQDGSALNLNAHLRWKAASWLDASAILSYSTTNTELNGYWGEKTNYIANLRQSEYGTEPPKGEYTHSLAPYGGQLTQNTNRTNSWTARIQLDMDKSFGEDRQHNFLVNLGFEASSTRRHAYYRIDRGYYDDRGKQFATGISLDDYPDYKTWIEGNHPTITDELSNLLSAYASVSYTYRNWFTLNANTRMDGSNQFGSRSNEKLLPIWSVSGAYHISEHLNIAPTWISNLALRLSYGYQGNMLDGQSPVMILQKLPMDAHYNELVSQVSVYPNPDLKWEKTGSFNVGLDFGLFNNAIQMGFSYYNKKTTDAFLTKNISSINGRTSYIVNSGEIKNSGYSVDLTTSPINNKDFRWTISASLSRVYNEVSTQPGDESYELDDFLTGNAITEGNAVGTFYSYNFIGLNPVDGGPMFDCGLERAEEYKGKTKYEVYTTALTPSGQRDPKYQGGISNSFRYKNLRLNLSLVYSLGSKVRLFRLYEDGINFDAVMNVHKDLLSRWKNPGDEKYTTIPCLVNANTPESLRYNSRITVGDNILIAENAWDMYDYGTQRVVSGNYLKCQDLSLSYDFQEKMLQKFNLSSLAVTLSASNLFTICSSKLNGQAPTQSGFSDIELSDRPTFSLGLNVSF